MKIHKKLSRAIPRKSGRFGELRRLLTLILVGYRISRHMKREALKAVRNKAEELKRAKKPASDNQTSPAE